MHANNEGNSVFSLLKKNKTHVSSDWINEILKHTPVLATSTRREIGRVDEELGAMVGCVAPEE